MLGRLDRFVEFTIGAIAVALIATAFGQVVARYVFGQSFAWVLEVDVMLMVWLTMLSGYVGVRRRAHMATDFLVASLSPAWRRRASILAWTLCALLVAIVGWTSRIIVDSMSGMYFVSIHVEQTVMYASLPVGMGLMLLAIVVELADLVRGGA